jgi:hypothetical protein
MRRICRWLKAGVLDISAPLVDSILSRDPRGLEKKDGLPVALALALVPPHPL